MNQDWGAVEIRVTPETLRRKADEVSRRIDAVKQLFSELESLVRSTRGYWIGEGGEEHRREYMDRRDDIEEMLRRLRLHPADLLRISGNYVEVETVVEENINILREDAIS